MSKEETAQSIRRAMDGDAAFILSLLMQAGLHEFVFVEYAWPDDETTIGGPYVTTAKTGYGRKYRVTLERIME